ncbi:unnamed protein product, partial [Prorocentrum cordatum]
DARPHCRCPAKFTWSRSEVMTAKPGVGTITAWHESVGYKFASCCVICIKANKNGVYEFSSAALQANRDAVTSTWAIKSAQVAKIYQMNSQRHCWISVGISSAALLSIANRESKQALSARARCSHLDSRTPVLATARSDATAVDRSDPASSQATHARVVEASAEKPPASVRRGGRALPELNLLGRYCAQEAPNNFAVCPRSHCVATANIAGVGPRETAVAPAVAKDYVGALELCNGDVKTLGTSGFAREPHCARGGAPGGQLVAVAQHIGRKRSLALSMGAFGIHRKPAGALNFLWE